MLEILSITWPTTFPALKENTGKLVRGSDMDLVVIADKRSAPSYERLDDAIYQESTAFS